MLVLPIRVGRKCRNTVSNGLQLLKMYKKIFAEAR